MLSSRHNNIYFVPRNYYSSRHNKISRGPELFGSPDVQRGNAAVIDTMKIHSGNTPTGIWAGMQITNIENTYPLGITPEAKDSEEGAHTGVNKRSRRKEAHDDDDSAGCDGGWRR